MPEFMLENQSDFSPEQTMYFLISGIIWIPLALVLLYGFVESFHQKLYPQYIIIAFLWLTAVCRCLWFFLRPFQHHVDVLGVRILSRIAMVSEFSAVSLLVLLWSRSLRATAFYKDSANSCRLSAPAARTSNVAKFSSDVSSIESGGDSGGNKSIVDSVAGSETRQSSLDNVRQMLDRQKSSSLMAAEAQQYLKHRRILWMCLITILWGVCIFNALIWTSRVVYDAYSIFLSVLSFVTSCLITYIGYLNFLRVRDDLTICSETGIELSDVAEGGAAPSAAPEVLTTAKVLYDFVVGTRSHRSKRFATQIDALRTVLRVSLVVSTLYLLQALGFLYKLTVVTMDLSFVECLKFSGSYYFIVLVVYQLPEFFPSLVIMHAVSSPTSVFRRPILMSWDNMVSLYKCEGRAGLTKDNSICMLLCSYCLLCCGNSIVKKRPRSLSTEIDEEAGAEVGGGDGDGSRPVLRRVVSVSEGITSDFDESTEPIGAIGIGGGTAAGASSSSSVSIEMSSRSSPATRLSTRPMSTNNPIHQDSTI